MRRAWLLVAAVVVVVAVALFATCERRRDAPSDAAAPVETPPPVARTRQPVARVRSRAAADETTSGRGVAAPAAVTAQLMFDPIGAKVAAPRKFVRGRVVNAQGKPVVGIDVEVVSFWLPPELARRERQYASAHVATSADGTFALPYVEGGPRGLIVKRSGFSSSWRWSKQTYFGSSSGASPSGDEEVQEIVLPDALPSVVVRVTRADDGAPIAAAEIRLAQQAVGWLGWHGSPARVEWGESRGEPGVFRYEGVAAGSMTLYVAAPGLAPFEREISIPADGETTIDVALKSGVVARGTVVDAATNRGVAGARVRWESRMSPAVLETDCDDDGKFALEHLPFEPNALGLMTAGADGYADTMFVPSGLVDGATECSAAVSLARPATVSLRCVDAARRPLTGVLVAAYSDYESTPFNGARTGAHTLATATTDPDGRATLAKFHPGTALRVFCYVDGVRAFGHAFPALVAGETRDLGDVVLAPTK